MKQIIIGKKGNQPFVITDDYVSRIHAIFTYEETTGIMTLTNKGVNGTYIRMGNQFQRIEQCYVNATTIVRLGPNFTFSIGQLFTSSGGSGDKPKPKPKERMDISHLRRIAENYEETKLKLEQKQANVNSLRTLSLVGSISGGTISGILMSVLGEEYKIITLVIGLLISIIFLVSLMVYCSKKTKEIAVKKSQNEKRYKIAYCCPNPKCNVPLAGRLFENIVAEGKCPKCKTEYYVSKS